MNKVTVFEREFTALFGSRNAVADISSTSA